MTHGQKVWLGFVTILVAIDTGALLMLTWAVKRLITVLVGAQ